MPAPSTISCPATPSFAQATATDACGSTFTLTFADVTTNGACAGSYSVTRTWTGVEAAANTARPSHTIIVHPTTAPVISQLPAPSTVSCPAIPEFATATATDACGSDFTLTFNDVTTNGACAGSYSVTRTWTATDACGNTSTASQTINIQDTTAPVISQLPAPSTISCTDTPQFATATATDNCGSTFTLTFNDVTTNGQCAGSYSVTRTWTATDACGNTSTASQTINVQDTVAPVIAQLPEPTTISCPATPSFAQATATDACGSTFTLTFNDVTTNGQCAGSYSVTRTWTATDACGNASTASQTINVQDITAPVIAALPAPSTINCPATPQFATATATDACGSAFTLTFADVTTNGNCANSYSVTRTWTATDACGNTSTASQTINVQDITAPAITTQAQNLVVQCDGSGNTSALNDWLANHGGASATDTCSAVTWTNDFNALANDCSAAVTVVFTATDACGNASTTSATFSVQDTTAPVAPAAPESITVACAAAVPANVSLTATDNCAGTITVEGVDSVAQGACANSFVVTRTWTFVDACNNTSSVSQTITVNDNIAPVIAELPAAHTISCPATPEFAQAIATDNCAGEVTLTFADVTTNGQCAGSYSVTRTWTATDVCGNTSTATQTINVEDTTAPVIDQLPSASTVSCPASPEFAQAIATDECGSAITLTFADITTEGQCAGSYSVTRTWTATDACGNSSTATQTINVEDTTAPVIAELPAASTIDCPATPEFAQAAATDACGSAITLTFADVTTEGQCSSAYSVTRTWTATDACGNSSTATQTINVQDVTPPVINAEASNIIVECDGNGSQGAIQEWLAGNGGATATDACSNVVWTNNFNNLSNDCSAAVTVIFTATDACGNAATTSATFTVQDTTAPVAPAAPESVTVACAGEVPAAATLTATDNCAGEVTGIVDEVVTPGACANTYTIVRTWTFTDACSNASTVSQTINVVDTVAPVAPAAPENVTVTCAGDVPAMISLTATDNCNDEITVEGADSIQQGQCGGSYVITRTWTFTDVCGNTSSVSQTITVNDTVAPTAPSAPENVTVTCSADVPAMISLTATDNCGTEITAEGVDSIEQGQCAGSYVVTRTWTFTDVCGNTSSVSQIITVNDTTAPTAPAAPADITISCGGEIPAMVPLTATDNCGEFITVDGVDTTVQGSCANSYVVTRTWTFTDACGNTSTAVQTITVSDQTAPVIDDKVPADITVSCTGEVPPMSQLTAVDNCNAEVITVDGVDVVTPGSCPNTFTITRTWSFTDACGNTSSAVQIITVSDNQAPTFNEPIPDDVSVSCSGVPAAVTLTASDNCNGGATVVMTESTNAGGCAGSYTLVRTWTATDACGNIATAEQHITVSDASAPTFDQAIPTDITVECDAIPTAPVLTATDNCGLATVTVTETTTPGACAGYYELTRTWTATDVCGNPTVGAQIITVIDTTAPVAVEPFEAVVAATCDAIPAVPQLTFADNCSGVDQATFAENIINQVPGGYDIVRTWTVTDTCGNVGTFTQTVNVTITNSDVQVPSRTCYTDISPVELNDLLPAGTPQGGTWVDVNNSGGLTCSTFVGNGVQLGTYPIRYDIVDPVCPRTVTVLMTVDTDCGPFPCNDIVIHNAFTPNGDGLNEYFSIENIEQFECYPNNKVEIYNRWGILVYETRLYDNAANSFKGISEGRATVSKESELPTGTYFYIVEWTASDGTTVKKDGYLYLSR